MAGDPFHRTPLRAPGRRCSTRWPPSRKCAGARCSIRRRSPACARRCSRSRRGSMPRSRRSPTRPRPTASATSPRNCASRGGGRCRVGRSAATPRRHEAIPRVLRAMHEHCRAQALLYPLRKRAAAGRAASSSSRRCAIAPRELDPDPRPDTPTGIITARQQRRRARRLLALRARALRRGARLAAGRRAARRQRHRRRLPVDLADRGARPRLPAAVADLARLDLVADGRGRRRRGAAHHGATTCASTGTSTPTTSSSPASPTARPTPCSAACSPTCRSPRWRRSPACSIPPTW